MTLAELSNVITTLGAIKGARLQEVTSSESDLGLGFWSNGSLHWLWIDLNAVRPSLLPWTRLPLKLKPHKSPLHLFLRAHFVDRTLHAIALEAGRGRVVQLRFGSGADDDPTLEVRLVPHLRNVIARAGQKQIAWQRPRDLSEEAGGEGAPRVERDLQTLRDQWLEARRAPAGRKPSAVVDPVARVKAELERRLKALGKVDEELARKRDLPWRALGDWLKAHQTLDVPREWEPFVDRRRKLAWNIEEAFTKARDLDAKLLGTEQRRATLEADIARLRTELTKAPGDITAPAAPRDNPLGGGAAAGRTLRLSDEVTVVAGKHAADNLKLLRRARAWDLWLHLRDYPGSHAILFRNKATRVTDEDLLRVSEWFVRLTLGKKVSSGDRFELLLAECRFVRPIKGDRIGRVTYRDERTLIFRAP